MSSKPKSQHESNSKFQACSRYKKREIQLKVHCLILFFLFFSFVRFLTRWLLCKERTRRSNRSTTLSFPFRSFSFSSFFPVHDDILLSFITLSSELQEKEMKEGKRKKNTMSSYQRWDRSIMPKWGYELPYGTAQKRPILTLLPNLVKAKQHYLEEHIREPVYRFTRSTKPKPR